MSSDKPQTLTQFLEVVLERPLEPWQLAVVEQLEQLEAQGVTVVLPPRMRQVDRVALEKAVRAELLKPPAEETPSTTTPPTQTSM